VGKIQVDYLALAYARAFAISPFNVAFVQQMCIMEFPISKKESKQI